MLRAMAALAFWVAFVASRPAQADSITICNKGEVDVQMAILQVIDFSTTPTVYGWVPLPVGKCHEEANAYRMDVAFIHIVDKGPLYFDLPIPSRNSDDFETVTLGQAASVRRSPYAACVNLIDRFSVKGEPPGKGSARAAQECRSPNPKDWAAVWVSLPFAWQITTDSDDRMGGVGVVIRPRLSDGIPLPYR